jgi:formylglycine-generating enzyme
MGRQAVRSFALGVLVLVVFCPVVRGLCHGDLNSDGARDLSDLAELLGNYGLAAGAAYEQGDLDGDGDIDLSDLAALLGLYGQPCPAAGDMVLVAAVDFQMGDTLSEGDADELPVHWVHLSPYYIDVFEITNRQYADALNWAYAQGDLIAVTDGSVYRFEGGTTCLFCTTTAAGAAGNRITWDGSTFGVIAGKEDHPMLKVTWYGAVAYCNWRSEMEGKTPCYNMMNWYCDFAASGYRLPTEAEWENAAAWDPAQARHFRFGEQTDGCGFDCLDGARANYTGSGDPFEVAGVQTTPVGYYDGDVHGGYATQDARSYWGCYDMTGNAWEWCHDRYANYPSEPQIDPTGPESGAHRILRGGGWGLGAVPNHCRTAYRGHNTPTLCDRYNGFRCARGTR